MGQQQKDNSRRTYSIMSWRRCTTLPFSKAWRFVSYNEDLRRIFIPKMFNFDVHLVILDDFEVVVPNVVQTCMSLKQSAHPASKMACGMCSHFSLIILLAYICSLTDLHLFQQNPMHFWCMLPTGRPYKNQQFMQVNILSSHHGSCYWWKKSGQPPKGCIKPCR